MTGAQAFAAGLSSLLMLAGLILLFVGVATNHVERGRQESDLPRPSFGYGLLLVAIGVTFILMATVPHRP